MPRAFHAKPSHTSLPRTRCLARFEDAHATQLRSEDGEGIARLHCQDVRRWESMISQALSNENREITMKRLGRVGTADAVVPVISLRDQDVLTEVIDASIHVSSRFSNEFSRHESSLRI